MLATPYLLTCSEKVTPRVLRQNDSPDACALDLWWLFKCGLIISYKLLYYLYTICAPYKCMEKNMLIKVIGKYLNE